MTQKSYFWNGLWSGDAVNAPYDATLYANIVAMLKTQGESFVFDYLNNLEVTVSVTSAAVNTGAAVMQGIYILEDAGTTLAVSANSTDFTRIDRVVIGLDLTVNSAGIYIKKGHPEETPHVPGLKQVTDVYWEMPLALLFIPSGATGLTDDNWIVDERHFFPDAQHMENYATRNIMPNSEFLAGPGTGLSGAPGMWNITTFAPTMETVTKFDAQTRGNAIKLTCASTLYGISHKFQISTVATVPVTIKFLIQVESGIARVNFGGTDNHDFYPTANPVEVIHRKSFSSSDQDFDMQLSCADANGTVFTIGQITVTYGYVAAPFVPKHETILFWTPVELETNTVSIVGSRVLDLETFAPGIGPNLQSALVRLDAADDTSSSTSPSAYIRGALQGGVKLEVLLSSLPNDSIQSDQGWIPLYRYANGTLEESDKFEVGYSTNNNLTYSVYMLGIKT